jgi:hypothetical protein
MSILDAGTVDANFTKSDLEDLDIGGVEASYMKKLASGSYKFLVKSAELEARETDEGPVPSAKLQFEVLEVVQLDKMTDSNGVEINTADFVGSTFTHTVWTLKSQKNLSYFIGLLTSIVGDKPKGGLQQFLQMLVDNNVTFVGRLKARPNKNDPEDPYINLSEDQKHFQSFKKLSEAAG